MNSPRQNMLAFSKHNHMKCVENTLASVEEKCAEFGLNFTAVRREVLKILLAEHRAIGAYVILDKLRQAGYKSQPPVAYRALEFLTENGFAHKVEKLNAFVACAHPSQDHKPAFMVCRECDAVAETPSASPDQALAELARTSGFHIEKTVIEIEGLCPDCQESAPECA